MTTMFSCRMSEPTYKLLKELSQQRRVSMSELANEI